MLFAAAVKTFYARVRYAFLAMLAAHRFLLQEIKIIGFINCQNIITKIKLSVNADAGFHFLSKFLVFRNEKRFWSTLGAKYLKKQLVFL